MKREGANDIGRADVWAKTVGTEGTASDRALKHGCAQCAGGKARRPGWRDKRQVGRGEIGRQRPCWPLVRTVALTLSQMGPRCMFEQENDTI